MPEGRIFVGLGARKGQSWGYCEGDNYRLVVEVKHVDEKKLEYEYIKKDSVDLIVQRRERFGVGCKVD